MNNNLFVSGKITQKHDYGTHRARKTQNCTFDEKEGKLTQEKHKLNEKHQIYGALFEMQVPLIGQMGINN